MVIPVGLKDSYFCFCEAVGRLVAGADPSVALIVDPLPDLVSIFLTTCVPVPCVCLRILVIIVQGHPAHPCHHRQPKQLVASQSSSASRRSKALRKTMSSQRVCASRSLLSLHSDQMTLFIPTKNTL